MTLEIFNTSGSLIGPEQSIPLSDSTFAVRFLGFTTDSVSGILSVHSTSLESVDALLSEKKTSFYDNPDWTTETALMFGVAPDGTVSAALCFGTWETLQPPILMVRAFQPK